MRPHLNEVPGLRHKGFRTPKHADSSLDEHQAEDVSQVNKKGRGQQYTTGFVEKEDGAKAPYGVRKGGGPRSRTEAKGQAGQRQAQKRGEQYPVKQSLAWRKPVVVVSALLLIYHLTSTALFGRGFFTFSSTLPPLQHRANKPENRVQTKKGKDGQHQEIHKARRVIKTRVMRAVVRIGVRVVRNEALRDRPMALATCRLQIRRGNGRFRIRRGKNFVRPVAIPTAGCHHETQRRHLAVERVVIRCRPGGVAASALRGRL